MFFDNDDAQSSARFNLFDELSIMYIGQFVVLDTERMHFLNASSRL